MNTLPLDHLKFVRSIIVRATRPKERYLFPAKSFVPASRKFGFDRGTPIDRFYIETFLNEHAEDIRGVCLEVGDNRYTKKFGGNHVSVAQVIDINPKNKKATIIGDLRHLTMIKDSTYDTVILTHVLGMIDDCQSAIKEVYRILKPGGNVLVTTACFAPQFAHNHGLWRIMPEGGRYLFEQCFDKHNIHIKTFGNVLAGQAIWLGLSQEDVTEEDLLYQDDEFPCVMGLIATK